MHGRGRVVMRAKTHFEELDRATAARSSSTSCPTRSTSGMLERIAELVNERKIDGISDIRDESEKSGMRVVIELKRGELPEVVLNNLYKQTQLQDTSASTCGAGRRPAAAAEPAPVLDAFLAHRARSSRGVPCSSCAARASAGTCSRGWRWRSPTSTR